MFHISKSTESTKTKGKKGQITSVKNHVREKQNHNARVEEDANQGATILRLLLLINVGL